MGPVKIIDRSFFLMKLFKYEGYKIVISEEAFALKVFRQIWNRDRTASKDKALMELGYVYFMVDPRSDYQYLVDEDERSKAIIEDTGMSSSWKPDKLIKEAMEFYGKFKPTAALLLEDTRYAVEKLRKLLRDIDLEEKDDKGKPVYTLNTITATIKQVPLLAKDLDEAEKALANEMRNSGRMRGQGEKTIMEDSLDI